MALCRSKRALGHSVCSIFAALLLSLIAGVAGVPEGVSLHGTTYTIADIESGIVEIETGSFIVGIKKGSKDVVLDAMKTTFDWTPKLRFSDSMPMFAGALRQDHILWLLRHSDVEYVENDGEVRALVKNEEKDDL
mmetsp:Transcript_151428/g.486058  ORF Transcript_151428/g.486058 Transcript_151428/m.486058 type:complete len:135 (-) Transcript_151428:82-486(-)